MNSQAETQHDSWFEMLQATANRFEDENDDLEAIIEGDIGFHAYFVAEGDDPTRGVHTAIIQGFNEAIQEVTIDADIVDINRGNVTPETVREEAMAQLNEFVYLPENIRESIGDHVEERVQKNMEASSDE